MKPLPALELVTRLEDADWLDPLAKWGRKAVKRLVRPRWVRDILHGVPVGHPVHPLAVQVPMGAWISVAVLDATPGNDRAANVLIGVGTLSAVPAAVAGFADWSELHPQQQRVGLIHAAANIAATTFYSLSLVQRARGRQASGKVLADLGLATVSVGGFLGGHLTYRQAAGVNHSEEIPHRFPPGWHAMAPLAEMPQGKLHKRDVAGIPLLVHREGDAVNVLSDVCSHLSGPLHEGKLGSAAELPGGDPADRQPCVECPWHKSTFALRTGEVLAGPATARQPRFSTRVADGLVEVCLPGAE
jgi:nitrite reductase/ring-hydroxylating ferredoxin subunit/uncharacterized membrane protein